MIAVVLAGVCALSMACSAKAPVNTTPTAVPNPSVSDLLAQIRAAADESNSLYQRSLSSQSTSEVAAALQASHKIDTPLKTLSDFARTDDEAKSAGAEAQKIISTRAQFILRSDPAIENAIAQVSKDQKLNDSASVQEARSLVCYDVATYLDLGRRPLPDDYLAFARNKLKKLSLTDTLLESVAAAEQQHDVIKVLNTVRQGDPYDKTIFKAALAASNTCVARSPFRELSLGEVGQRQLL